MSSPVQEFAQAVMKATQGYRKGDVITERTTEGGMKVIEVYGYPPKPEHERLIDLHFIWVGGVEGNSPEHLRDLFEAALEYKNGEFGAIDRDRAKGGPSYIEWGGWLGSQDIALQMLGLGELLGWWEVVTPERLGMPPDVADMMAGQGMIMNAGLKEQE